LTDRAYFTRPRFIAPDGQVARRGGGVDRSERHRYDWRGSNRRRFLTDTMALSMATMSCIFWARPEGAQGLVPAWIGGPTRFRRCQRSEHELAMGGAYLPTPRCTLRVHCGGGQTAAKSCWTSRARSAGPVTGGSVAALCLLWRAAVFWPTKAAAQLSDANAALSGQVAKRTPH